jgi:ATP-dependent helicase HrpB
LPIDSLLQGIAAEVRAAGALVIEAPPGAGKTTRVPSALLQAGLGSEGEIIVLQPRRLAARLAAERVADELGEPVGQTVGYTVRFAEEAGPATRIRFVTEGILLRRLLAEPELPGVQTVVLDEFHERHLVADLALALLRRLQRGRRPDLHLVVMSATLEAEPVCEFLECPSVRSEGRMFDVAIEYLDRPDDRPLSDQVAAAVRRLCQDEPEGDVLVFLPGAGEIRRAADALSPLAQSRDLLVLPLHGDLSPADQRRAVARAARRKVILSTNVAETSVTIDGVVAVVDSGLARIASHSPWTGLPTLNVAKISQAAATQRAGRAGRTRPGRALRLYARHDLESRRSHELPEIARLDLSEALLTLAASDVRDPSAFPWFEHPGAQALEAAQDLLRRLGALASDGRLTEIGQRMLRFPVHPRLARLIVEGERLGVGEDAAALAALVSEGDISDEARARFSGMGRSSPGGADLLERLDRFHQARAARFSPDRLRGLGVDVRAAEAVERARRQFASGLNRSSGARHSADQVDDALGQSTLVAFPDRVMRRRAPGSTEVVLSGGGAAEMGPLPPDDLLVGVDVEERDARRSGRALSIRLAVGVRPEWLLDLVPGELSERDEVQWNPATERVERCCRLCCGAVVLEESRQPAPPSPETSRLLAQAALSAGWGDQSGALPAKLELLRQAFPEADVPVLDEAGWREAVVAACEGMISLAELRETDLEGRWVATLPSQVAQLLRTEVPERIRLPGGRTVPVHYEAGKPPWIESRLQDFFGMATGPRVCRGRVPVTLHLLAPNQRAVQVTSDLANFWRQHYPAIRRELCRRYPRHPWPEDGATATPPPPRPPRPR